MISLRSNLRRKLLTFFYVNRSARVYVRQLAAALGADSTNVSRELARLEREGLLRSETEGRQLYYSINRAYPYLKPVFALLQGSIGIEPTLKHALKAVAGLQSAWIYGSFAKKRSRRGQRYRPSDHRPAGPDAGREDRKVEKALRREINYTVLTSGISNGDFRERRIHRRHLERKAHRVDWPMATTKPQP